MQNLLPAGSTLSSILELAAEDGVQITYSSIKLDP